MTHELDVDQTTREDWGKYIRILYLYSKNILSSYCSFKKLKLGIADYSISYFGMPTKDFE